MGGNLKIANSSATRISLNQFSRQQIVSTITAIANCVAHEFELDTGIQLWNWSNIQIADITSGSTKFLFDPSISDTTLQNLYPEFGDIDLQLPVEYSSQFSNWLNSKTALDEYELLGSKRGNEQVPSLWYIPQLNLNMQIDFEFVEFKDWKPTEWAQFSKVSSFDDVSKLSTKGVHHKWFLQSLTRAHMDEFRVVIPAPAETLEASYYSLAFTSKEGGGLRRRFLQMPVEDTREFARAPRANYNRDVKHIFETLLGSKYNHITHSGMTTSLYEAAMLANFCLTTEQKHAVFMAFVDKCLGKSAQVVYRNDPGLDLVQKQTAIQYVANVFEVNLKFHVVR